MFIGVHSWFQTKWGGMMGTEHWVEMTLDKVVLYKKGKKPKKLETDEFKNSVPYIDIEAFETGRIKQYAEIASSNCCDEKDVLVVWDGARFGLTGCNQRGSVGSTLACLTPVVIESSYLLKFIQRHYSTIQTNPKGTGIPHVNPDIFWNLGIPLPPLKEQKRIVEKLDAILSRVKSAKTRLEKIPGILKKFRQSVLAAACSGRLTEEWRAGKDLPDWIETTIGNINDFITSGSRGWAEYYSDEGAIFIRAQNISKDYLDLSDIAHIKLPKKAEGKRTSIKKFDILITITGANVTKSALVNLSLKEAYVNQHVALVRLSDIKIAPFVFLFIISSANGRKQLEESAYGVGKPGLNLQNIKDISLSLPPLPEQHEIVLRVEKLFALADSLEAKYKKAQSRVEKLEQAILAKAFRGELVEPDPNDEPAAELLKRIVAEKAKLEAGKKPRKKK